ncbi:MAG: hypothetical protein ACWA5A_18880 [Marinibacterium sp.]
MALPFVRVRLVSHLTKRRNKGKEEDGVFFVRSSVGLAGRPSGISGQKETGAKRPDPPPSARSGGAYGLDRGRFFLARSSAPQPVPQSKCATILVKKSLAVSFWPKIP